MDSRDEERAAQISRLAQDVLKLSRNQLLVNLRFLDAALSRLEPAETEEIGFATDGRYLAYDPKQLLRRYRSDRKIPVRDYLHAVLHCIYRHMFAHPEDQVTWDLACDAAVEYTISRLGLEAAAAPREARQRAAFAELEKEVDKLTAEKLYRHWMDKKLPPEKLADLRALFYADEHRLWYMSGAEKAALGLGQGDGNGDGDGSGEGNDEGSGSGGSGEGDESGNGPGSGGLGAEADEGTADLCSEADWQKVSERVQMDLETFSKGQGRDPGALLQNLRELNREKYDYTAFLRRFAVMGEVMKTDPADFDTVFYTYGLQLYGNLPLIEPLEYREEKRIREFVIAIDTSGSVAGETVQRFVQKTWNILKSSESFFTKINLHIIQCDAKVQEDAKITSQEDFDAYIKGMKLRGLGGTDFRPVFGYVDWLLEKKEFTNLKGLIYFTDGFGTFPERMPPYQAAFVFLSEEINNPEVPPWAVKLVLRDEEI